MFIFSLKLKGVEVTILGNLRGKERREGKTYGGGRRGRGGEKKQLNTSKC